MREKIKDRGRLEHILDAINGIMSDKDLYTYEQVNNSKLLFYGFTKYVEIIGEAVYMLSKEFRETHPQVAVVQRPPAPLPHAVVATVRSPPLPVWYRCA